MTEEKPTFTVTTNDAAKTIIIGIDASADRIQDKTEIEPITLSEGENHVDTP